MISLSSVDALTHAQTQLNTVSRRISQGAPSPENMVALLQAREQFSEGIKVVKTEDQMTKKLLDVMA